MQSTAFRIGHSIHPIHSILTIGISSSDYRTDWNEGEGSFFCHCFFDMSRHPERVMNGNFCRSLFISLGDGKVLFLFFSEFSSTTHHILLSNQADTTIQAPPRGAVHIWSLHQCTSSYFAPDRTFFNERGMCGR